MSTALRSEARPLAGVRHDRRMRTIGMTLKQAETIVAAARENGADSFLATQDQGSMLVEASLLAEEDGDGIVDVIVVDEHGTIVATGDSLED